MLFSIQILLLLIVSINCNLPPVIQSNIQPLIVKENIPIGTELFTISAKDPEGSELKYSIQNSNYLFVNSRTGLVTTARKFDREHKDTINAVITVEDQVKDGANNVVPISVELIILDVNDNKPSFAQRSYDISIPEDSVPGTAVIELVKLTDADQIGDALSVLCLENGEISKDFSMLPKRVTSKLYEGSLILRSALSFASRREYRMTLSAFDGNNTAVVPLTVKVADVQNSPPKFSGSTTGIVSEDAPIGHLVMVVKAEDQDIGDPRAVMYELVESSMDFFALDRVSGELRVARPLDRESFSEQNGVVSLAVNGYETERGLRINEENSETSIDLFITIQDVNDETPSFSSKEYRVSIPENHPFDTPLSNLAIEVTDKDAGVNSAFQLRLEDPTGYFSISPPNATGSASVSLKLAKENGLDFENPNERKFILLVVAEELFTKERLSSTATIIVTVLDINDNRPRFAQEVYSTTVSETASRGTVVASITATDIDSGAFGTESVVYNLVGEGAEKFGVDKISGVITVASCGDTPGTGNCLDYEKQSIYFFSYEAIDEGGRGLKTTVPLRIAVIDVNDNPPTFKQTKIESIIQEGESEFTPPLIIKAVDKDASSILRYSIVGGDPGRLFGVNRDSGEIRIRNPRGLSISQLNTTQIILKIEASDGVGSALLDIFITIEDINNNVPRFKEASYEASVPENSPKGTVVERVTAVDLDIGVNSDIEYSIIKGAYDDFSINSSTGDVYVSDRLNFDLRRRYDIELIASDKGIPRLRSEPVILHIDIINNNNKNPYFTPTTQRIQVKEDIPVGTVVHKLTAQDGDISFDFSLYFSLKGVSSAVNVEGNALSSTEISKYNDLFSVTETGNVVLDNPLNRNKTVEITLIVQVSDVSVSPQQTSEGYLVITITDVNNHPPAFSHPWSNSYPYLFVTVPEELPVGSVVTTLEATDPDSNIAEFKLVSESDLLVIDQSTGVVTAKGRLDFENNEFANATVTVTDTGLPQLTSTATLIVKLQNINDEKPVFEEQFYEGRVREHSNPGTFVTRVRANDKDRGKFGIVNYKLTGEHDNMFTIDSSGSIRVKQGAELDREKTPEFTVRVVAFDNSPLDMVKQSSVSVRIVLLDINDNSPSFDQKEFAATLVENLPLYPPIPLLQVRASDLDEGANAELRYKIISGNEQGIFRLNSTSGFLFQSSKIDVSENEEFHTFNLTVEARDENGLGSLFDVATVNIKVLPKNEFKPKFIHPPRHPFLVTIPEESAEENLLVLTARATDEDSGLNGEVKYFFRNHEEENVGVLGPFKINSSTGEIRTTGKLDRETKAKYKLLLVAKDLGAPTSFETLCILNINLNDTNDHSPVFAQSQSHHMYRFAIKENLPADTWIGQVEATDLDTKANARIFYYIVNGNSVNNFYIDESNGNLFSAVVLDREQMASYQLRIKATNHRQKPDSINLLGIESGQDDSDSSMATVVIEVEDVNDNPPRFSRKMFYAGVSFDAKVGSPFYKIEALDRDGGINGTLTYSILSSIFYRPGENKPIGSIVPSPFNLTKDGKLLTASLMYPYKKHRFLVKVEAREAASPYRTDVCSIYILVWQEQDLIKVIFEEPPTTLAQHQNEITRSLSKVFEGQAVIDEIRYFTSHNKTIIKNWTEILMHIVTKSSHLIPPDKALNKVDRGYKLLKNMSRTSSIRSIYPMYKEEIVTKLDVKHIGLLILVLVLLIGLVIIVVFCCCLRFMASHAPKSKKPLIQEVVEDDHGLNATENPLWIDMKLKRYEEQELSMHVSSEFDPSAVSGHQMGYAKDPQQPPNARNGDQACNTYATIQKSMGSVASHQQSRFRHESLLNSSLVPKDDIYLTSDYDTIEGPRSSGHQYRGAPDDPQMLQRHRLQVEQDEMITRFSDAGVNPVSQTAAEQGNMINRPLPKEPSSICRENFRPRVANRPTSEVQEPCLVSELI